MAGNWFVVVPEGTQNLVSNPSLETDATGWSDAANATVSQYTSAADGVFGRYCGACSCSGTGNRYVYHAFTRGANDDITVSAWVKAVTGSPTVRIQVRDSGLSVLASGTTTTLSTS